MKKKILLATTLCLLLVVLVGCDAENYPSEFDLTIGVVDREAPQVREVYKADGESSAMVILEENNGFALQGSVYMSFMPSGQYRIEDGKLFLSMGDDYIIFLIEENRLIFESGTWLEFLVEKGTVFHLMN